MIPPYVFGVFGGFGGGLWVVVVWGFGGGGFFLELFLELWIFDDGLDGFSFHSMSVGT